jgi:Ca2+-binding EF-hand superfamily protein
MDTNGDQEISQDEFVGAQGRAVKDRPGFDAAMRTAADALVQVADRDGKGALDPGEYTRLAAVYGARAEEAARTFDRLDQDHNGVLDTAELALGISQFFVGDYLDGRGSVT